MSNVRRDGESVRPSWRYLAKSSPNENYDSSKMEMLESIRNACEQIRDSQMLQCDVASAIKSMAREIRGLRRDLKKKGKS